MGFYVIEVKYFVLIGKEGELANCLQYCGFLLSNYIISRSISLLFNVKVKIVINDSD